MLEEKRAEVLETVRQCMEATHTAANGDSKASHLIEKSDKYFSQCKEKIAELKSLALLDAMFLPMCQYKDDTVSNIESVLAPPAPKPVSYTHLYCMKNSSRQNEKNRVKWEHGFWELIRNDCAVK